MGTNYGWIKDKFEICRVKWLTKQKQVYHSDRWAPQWTSTLELSKTIWTNMNHKKVKILINGLCDLSCLFSYNIPPFSPCHCTTCCHVSFANGAWRLYKKRYWHILTGKCKHMKTPNSKVIIFSVYDLWKKGNATGIDTWRLCKQNV